MLIDKIYDFIRFLKNQGQSQYFSPEEVIGLAFNRASLDLFIDEHREFESNGRIGDNLRNFKVETDITKNVDDKFLLPTGEETPPIPLYFAKTNIGSLVTEGDPPVESEYRGRFFTDGEWIDANTSSLLPPEDKNMQARIANLEIKVKPDTLTKIRLYYLTKPVEAVYAYDTVLGKITFKEDGSVDPDWPITAHGPLIMRTIKYLGITLSDQVLIYAEDFIKQSASKS